MAVFGCSMCTSPLRAHQAAAGGPLSFRKSEFVSGRWLDVACNRCLECRLDRARSWSIRCVHEAQMCGASSFITLTYDDSNVPPGGNLLFRDYQLFQKRVCKRFGSNRFFACGEYGEQLGRPHYHACLFGISFEDRVPWKKSESGEQVYRSAVLERLWSLGHSSVGDVTMRSAGYVARYVLKKDLGPSVRRTFFDPVTGMTSERVHEFQAQSLRPGIGRSWLECYWRDVYPHGFVVVDGVKMKPPRYYDEWFRVRDPVAHAAMLERRAEMVEEPNVRRDGRLEAEAHVMRAKASFLKRSVE